MRGNIEEKGKQKKNFSSLYFLIDIRKRRAVSGHFQIHSDTLTGYQKKDNIQEERVSVWV